MFCFPGKCSNQLGFMARISRLEKSRRLLVTIYQHNGKWNTYTNLLLLLATSVFHQKAGFPKWLSHSAEKMWKCLILQELDLGLYKYICIVGKKTFPLKNGGFSALVSPQPPVTFLTDLLWEQFGFQVILPLLVLHSSFRQDAGWGSSVLQQLNCTKLLSMRCCFLVIWKENFPSIGGNTLELCHL